MRSAVAVSLVVLASSVGVALAQTPLEIFTPPQPPVQCQATLITWQGGMPPYIVSVLDNTVDPTTPVIQFTGLTNTSITWIDHAPAGDELLFTIKDMTGLSENSAPMTVATGGSTSCLSSSSSGTGSASSTSSTGSAPSGSSKSAVSSSSVVSTTTVTTTTPLTTTTTTAPSLPASSTKPPSSTGSATSSKSGSASASAPSSSNTTGAAMQVPAPAFAAALAAVFAFLL
ncbi:hypothetical protein C8R45DRAFT_955923 [Mycena sanguinolenta]|nr:hypothetical protein C8R45DRAFT_955923 [Mycena sanguinolenta]